MAKVEKKKGAVETVKSEDELVREANAESADGLSAHDLELVSLHCDPPISINGHKYEGDVKVPRHVAQTIIPMLQAKIRTDMEIFTGKSRIVERMADRRLVIREGKV